MLVGDCKRKKIEEKSRKQLKKWLRNEKRQVPAVIGPDGDFYITDHHHLATAVYRALPDKDQCATFGPGANSWFMEFYWADFLRGATPIASADQPVCTSMPYTKACLPNEVGALAMIYPAAMLAVESEQAKAYFRRRALDPMKYGFNASGDHLGLKITTGGCEEVTD